LIKEEIKQSKSYCVKTRPKDKTDPTGKKKGFCDLNNAEAMDRAFSSEGVPKKHPKTGVDITFDITDDMEWCATPYSEKCGGVGKEYDEHTDMCARNLDYLQFLDDEEREDVRKDWYKKDTAA